MNLEKVVSVTWMDAANGSFDRAKGENKEVNEFLVERISYGKLYKVSEQGVVITTTEDDNIIEYIAIPSDMIREINYYETARYNTE